MDLIYRDIEQFISVSQGRKVVIYDTGNAENVIAQYRDNVDLAFIVNDEFWKWNTEVAGLAVKSPHALKNSDYVVLITTPYYAYAVEKKLIAYQVRDYYCHGFFLDNLYKSFKVGFNAKNIPGRVFSKTDTLTIQIALTNKCNLRCPFCVYRYATAKTQPDMPLEAYTRILDDIQGLWIHGALVDTIEMDGSRELFVYPQYKEAIIETHCRGFKIFIVTNGVLLTSENSKLLLENGLSKIIISVGGITPETYVQHQGYNERSDNIDFAAKQLEKVKMNVKELVRLRNALNSSATIAISYIVDDVTKAEIRRAVSYWQDVGIDFFWGNAIQDTDDEGYVIKKRARHESQPPRGVCYSPGIDSAGNLHPCCGDGKGELITLGNVFETPLSQLIYTDSFNEFYENLASLDASKMNPNCLNCPSSGMM